ncbi:RipA family octameric membrane protein [Micromonospora arida]|uniref:RipA family octameric membrane protein n=1 Tax=Micromonospora arida TaxID=2203715 RepID=UPI003F4B2AFB
MTLRRSLERRQIDFSEIRSSLWSPTPEKSSCSPSQEQEVVLEQYKIYVEMADRVSARRGLANTFFLTLNTTAASICGWFNTSLQDRPRPALALLLFVLLVQTTAWYVTLRSYRQLNSAKFRVVGALEERLPASPYWRAEWKALDHGRNKRLYWPITRLEQWIPSAFAFAYVGLFVVALVGE